MKKEAKKFPWYQGAVLVGVLAVIGLLFWQPTRPKILPQVPGAQFKSTVDAYLDLHTADNWWISQVPQPNDFPRLAAQTKSMEEKVAKALRTYRALTPETQRIADTFDHFHVSYSTGNSSVMVGKAPDSLLGKQSSMEVCFFSKQERPTLPTSLFYRREWKAVLIAAVDWPEPVLAAELFHELGHALADKEGRPSATAVHGSPAWVQEEIQMHTLEGSVLNEASREKYFAKLDAILQRDKPPVPEASFCLTLDDLKELDQMFGCEKSGKELASVMLIQHCMMLGLRSIDQQLSTAKRFPAQVELYQRLENF